MDNSISVDKEARRRGLAMIILVVIIALGILVFVLQKKGVFKRGPKDPNEEGIMPWTEWKLRQSAVGQESGTSAGEHREVGRLQYGGNALLAGSTEGRGQIKLYLTNDGVRGDWSGSYWGTNKKQYDVTSCGFSGSYYPEKKYVDANGNEDPSQLYFLCAGEFYMMETGKQAVKIIGGEIYVRGWLGADNMIVGRAFITSDHKYYREFEFHGRAAEPSVQPLFGAQGRLPDSFKRSEPI
jgi:hypothetical protein